MNNRMEEQNKFQAFKSAVNKNAGKVANWLWTSVKKKTNDIAGWILTQKDKIINKIFPSKVTELIELSNNSSPKNNTYWQINIPYSDEGLITKKVAAARK